MPELSVNFGNYISQDSQKNQYPGPVCNFTEPQYSDKCWSNLPLKMPYLSHLLIGLFHIISDYPCRGYWNSRLFFHSWPPGECWNSRLLFFLTWPRLEFQTFFTLDHLEFQLLLEFQTFLPSWAPSRVGIPDIFVGIVLEFQDLFFVLFCFSQQPLEF